MDGADSPSLEVPHPGYGRRRSSSPVSFAYLNDPRSSSTQSLVPTPSEQDTSGRRRLLVIYIHGFMGNDASFQSFPAHVHQYLKLALADTHVIHSKIYPRYKTYKALDVARDNFSKWLAPHESPTTDIVLVGHSMGGLLAADVALMPSRNQYSVGYFLHRILGTVNLDAPFLGLHASVITAGLASLFRPKTDVPGPPEEPIPEDESTLSLSNVASVNNSLYSDPSSSSRFSPPPSASPGTPGLPYGMTFDPNFNPSFNNDARVQDRGWWKNIVHFVEKHNSEGLVDAATYHITSHLEFGGCLLDPNALRTRYENIRRLEDVDDLKYRGFPHVPPQVRFVQYYTVCHGYPKKPKGQNSNHNTENLDVQPAPSTPRIAIQNPDGLPSPQALASTSLDNRPLSHDSFDGHDEEPELQILAPEPIYEEDEPEPESNSIGQPLENPKVVASEGAILLNKNSDNIDADTKVDSSTNLEEGHEKSSSQGSSDNNPTAATGLPDALASLYLDLPEVPEPPTKPELPDLDQYTDKNARKQAEKESKQVQKDYAKLVKEREKAIKERQKTIDKRKKKLTQETEKREKEEQKRRKKEEAMMAAASSSATPEDAHLGQQGPSKPSAKPPKPPKERKFCNLSKTDGQVDSKWVKIFIKDVDQVAAHTSLFFRGDHYEKLVGDVGDTILRWVQDDLTKRAILDMDVPPLD
ncbi:hypothetical protein M426DRAFT_19792 [Hypoxylon sp. CI-4A]|nr:hypothetical protein M426DRAFT_19792 [Hypoxylon sp. CI-4A]